MKRHKLAIFSFMFILISKCFVPDTASAVNPGNLASNAPRLFHQIGKIHTASLGVKVHISQEINLEETNSYEDADGVIVYPGETGDTKVFSDGKTIYPDGTTTYPDGKIVDKNGVVVPHELSRADAKVGIGDYGGAIKEINKFLIRYPDSADGYFRRGIYNRIVGNYEEAIEDLDKSAQLYSAEGLEEIHNQAVKIRELTRNRLNKR